MKKIIYRSVVFLSILFLSSCTIVIDLSGSSIISSSNISTTSSNISSNSRIISSNSINSSIVEESSAILIDYNGRYTSKDDVSLYLFTYHELPINFITKSEASALGWSGGSIPTWTSQNKLSIGGDVFQNREQLLPIVTEITYYECDINYNGSSRGAQRIVYSSNWSIYYTSDHYASFTRLY